jgi:hypothetical protein
MKLINSLYQTIFNILTGSIALVLAGILLLIVMAPIREAHASVESAYKIYLPLASKGLGQNVSAPIITSFEANPAIIEPGGTSMLSWNVVNATSLSIAPGIGTVTGTNKQVSPTVTTKYTLTASNSAGNTTAELWVTVQEPESEYGFFLPGIPEIDGPTSHPTVVVDPANGVHVTFTPESAPASNPGRAAYYAYCPLNCSSANAFTITLLRQDVIHANLALDPAGHPRILLTAGASDNIPHYEYGTCETNCSSAAQWTFTPLTYFVPSSVWGVEFSNRFAIDDQGRPRFVYQDQLEAHSGNFFGYCNQDCNNLENWYEIQLGTDLSARIFELALSPSGQPRLVASSYDSENITTFLVYLECDTGCVDAANWRVVRLLDTVSASVEESASYHIRTDSSGRPRILYYTGTGSGGTYPANVLYYLSCDAADCAQLENWFVLDLNFPYFHGEQGVALAFDPQDRPRIAYHAQITAGFGLYYAWCNSNCSTSAADWQTQKIEPSEQVDQELPIPPAKGCPFPLCNPPKPACTLSFWDTGVRPSLALDSAGNPRIAYDADHNQGGNCPPYSDTRLTRFIQLAQP